MFTATFSRFQALPGDSTTCWIDGTEYTARIEFDPNTFPSDFECYSVDDIRSWSRDEWQFVGIVVGAERNGVELDNHLASLWGIESDSSPEYFLEVANDLLREAIPLANEARKRIALAMA